MRDEQGYFGRFKQCLYLARLQTEQLEQVETAASTPTRFDGQQQLAYSEAAIDHLYRSLCFLSCLLLPASDVKALLDSPSQLPRIVEAAAADGGSAGLQLLQRQMGAGLTDLVAAHARLWQPSVGVKSAGARSGLIAVQEVATGSGELRRWASEMTTLSEQLIDLETES